MSQSLIHTWTAPARRRSGLNDALIAAPVALAVAALAWRLWGLAPALVVLVLASALAAVAVWRRVQALDRGWLVRSLDRTRPEMEDSTGLLFAEAQLNPLQRLQQARLAARLDRASPTSLAPDWRRRPALIAWGVAAVVILAAVAWPRATERPVTLAPASEGAATPPGAPRLVGQNLRIYPPAYTGLPMRDERSLDARAPVGSRLEWTLRFAPNAEAPRVMMLGGAPMALRRDGEDWVASRTLDASFLYRVETGVAGAAPAPLHRIDATPDTPPQVKAISPNDSLTLVTPGQRRWTPVFAATDDYGVAATARLRITLAIGEGENVTFSEREIAVTGRGDARDRRFSPTLDFSTYGFGPGSDMVVQLIVRDNRSLAPQEMRGPSLILRWPSQNAQEASGLEGMVNTVLPAYFRSQRQVIIDAQRLIRERRQLSDERFLQRSMAIGGDQEILRGRYSQFLGGESEGPPELPTSDGAAAHSDNDGHDHGAAAASSAPVFGAPEDVLAAFGHPHDDSQASSLSPETQAILRRAVNAMWLSERELKTGRPAEAIPHAEEALRYIKQVQEATRVFLARVGPELPPIDPARRMTGKREGLDSRALPVTPVEAGDGPAAAAWRALGDGPGAIRGPIALEPLEAWARANAGRLPDALALRSAIDAVRIDSGCAECRRRLRAQLWLALERPPANLARRPAVDAAGARYLGALGGGGS